jgi:DNA-binding NarL/FixJ family response regulator
VCAAAPRSSRHLRRLAFPRGIATSIPISGAQLVVADGTSALGPISDPERDVLHLLALGHTNQEIGRKLYISVRTVDTHRAHIMRKARVRDARGARAVRAGQRPDRSVVTVFDPPSSGFIPPNWLRHRE